MDMLSERIGSSLKSNNGQCLSNSNMPKAQFDMGNAGPDVSLPQGWGNNSRRRTRPMYSLGEWTKQGGLILASLGNHCYPAGK